MMEMEATHPKQGTDMIDILWKQDIDLGARREVFDSNHRQKEYEVQRQLELEEEKRLHLLRQQEAALLAQLQLDEETGEYIPRPPTSAPPPEVTQSVCFAEGGGDALSLDECLQLLADTFPVEETQDTSICLDTAAVVPMLSPDHPSLPPPSPLSSPAQTMSPDLEQAWMELLSLPELQHCLNTQLEDTLATTAYPLAKSPDLKDQSYPFFPMTDLTEGETNIVNARPAEFTHTFAGSDPNVAPTDRTVGKTPQFYDGFAAESFCDVFYPDAILEESKGRHESEMMPETPNKLPFSSLDLYSLSPRDASDRGKNNSDSGISLHSSPNVSSPGKSLYGDGSFIYSDSDTEEMDHNPGSSESDYSEMFAINFQLDDLQAVSSASEQPQLKLEMKPRPHKTDPAEESGHKNTPLTRDKQRRRSEVRLSRDEQRAKALKIPFTVNTIINQPVDDFNELMSKHRLNDAQLALVRDIRRRGKNKVAAQNCRKRKMENIVGLEGELDSLQEEKARLRCERNQNMVSLKEMKRELNSLYLEVFGMLRDEKGNSYSPSDYSLQQSTNGSIFLVPRVTKTSKSRENSPPA
ncbi:nuclear factor erythroid 2-related factor 2a [Brachionichthys hirsutus]|uniref:nuclear factor erythroid 2-related factor 2a n=1 Tax=Brachionichthys hirsutus TaxID=412623 RepID=UPI00360430B7